MHVERYTNTKYFTSLSLCINVYEYVRTHVCTRVTLHLGVFEQDENVGECVLNGIYLQTNLYFCLFVYIYMNIYTHVCMRE